MTISAIDSQAGGSAALVQQLRQRLFQKVDPNTDGQITEAELEAAATAKGGSAQQGDSLYVGLGGNADGSGSLSQSQVDTGLQQLFDSATQNQLNAVQSS